MFQESVVVCTICSYAAVGPPSAIWGPWTPVCARSSQAVAKRPRGPNLLWSRARRLGKLQEIPTQGHSS
eukprot:8492928-Pyramimonas_sp.AAC.1